MGIQRNTSGKFRVTLLAQVEECQHIEALEGVLSKVL